MKKPAEVKEVETAAPKTSAPGSGAALAPAVRLLKAPTTLELAQITATLAGHPGADQAPAQTLVRRALEIWQAAAAVEQADQQKSVILGTVAKMRDDGNLLGLQAKPNDRRKGPPLISEVIWRGLLASYIGDPNVLLLDLLQLRVPLDLFLRELCPDDDVSRKGQFDTLLGAAYQDDDRSDPTMCLLASFPSCPYVDYFTGIFQKVQKRRQQWRPVLALRVTLANKGDAKRRDLEARLLENDLAVSSAQAERLAPDGDRAKLTDGCEQLSSALDVDHYFELQRDWVSLPALFCRHLITARQRGISAKNRANARRRGRNGKDTPDGPTPF